MQDVFLTVRSRLAFFIELRLQVREIVFCSIDQLVRFRNTILDLLGDGVFKCGQSLVSECKLLPIMLPHRVDLSFKIVTQLFELVLKL